MHSWYANVKWNSIYESGSQVSVSVVYVIININSTIRYGIIYRDRECRRRTRQEM